MPLERNSPMSERVRAASVNDLSEETGLELALKGKIIALYKVDDEVLAMDGICPHAGGPLGKGTVTNGIVTCPWHGWQFDLTTGQHCLTPQICQTQYAVEVDGEEIFVIFPES